MTALAAAPLHGEALFALGRYAASPGGVSARAAFQELLAGGALLVDIRPAAERAVEGDVAAWLPVATVGADALARRLDPRGAGRLPEASYDLRVLVLSGDGHAASAAVDLVRRRGVRRAIGVVGGFAAWRATGMPVTAGPAGAGE